MFGRPSKEFEVGMRNSKLAIIGKLPDKFNAPFNDMNWDIWGCNWHDDFFDIPRYTEWFDIHKKVHPMVEKHIEFTKLNKRVEYVFEFAKGIMQGEYLNNSMCYMLFLAYIKGYNEVCFYGCSLTSPQEIREQQRRALNNVIMFCRGKGMKISSNMDILIDKFDRYEV